MTVVSPSALSIDFSRLNEQIEAFNQSEAEYLHFDVMDGHLVPNLTFGPDILKGLKKMTSKVMDVHLMVTDPVHYAEVFVNAGADIITFHIEAIKNDAGLALVDDLHQKQIRAGITLKPKTSVETLIPYLEKVDMVLVMSVEPGFGGQSFMADMLEKVRFLKQYREEHQLSYLIEIDGGINEETGKLAKEAGCDILVAGSYVFNHPQGIKEAVRTLL
ncbi:MAG: ribulose-phosphate 3-epimerase [Erysipelotrichaceae bacterium]|nr:ribulose-phosphate 3-epimerase [Erysipelotrichaceae bacterium]